MQHKIESKGLFFEDAKDLTRIGRIYAEGRSIPSDPVMAYQLFSLAAMKGCRAAVVARQHISAELTRDEFRLVRKNEHCLPIRLSPTPTRSSVGGG